MGVFHTTVAGVTATNADGQSRQNLIISVARAGMPVELIREPNNAHDPNAVGVWISGKVLLFLTARGQIGYIPRDLAPELARHIDGGGTVRAHISEILGGTRDKPTHGVLLELEKR